MPEIDELVVRLDADLKPLEAKLKRAEALSAKSAARIEKALSRISGEMSNLEKLVAAGPAGPRPTFAVARSQAGGSSSSAQRDGRIVVAQDEGGGPEPDKLLLERIEEGQRSTVKEFLNRTLDLEKALRDFMSDPLRSTIKNFPEGEAVDTRDLSPNQRATDILKLEEAIRASRATAETKPGASGDIFREQAASFEAAQEMVLRAFERDLQGAFTTFERTTGGGADVLSDAPGVREDLSNLVEAFREAERLVELGDKEINRQLAPDLEAVRRSFEALGIKIDNELITSVGQLAEKLKVPIEPTAAAQMSARVEAAAASATVGSDVQSASDLAQQICACLKETLAEFGDDLAKKLCECREMAGNSLDPGGGGSLGHVPTDGGVIPAVFDLGTDGAGVDGLAGNLQAIDGQAAAWQAVLDRLDKVPPALARTRQETLDVDRAVKDLGFTFASAFEDAIVSGESLSDILQGLERDILRILTRLLITEPLARGLTAGLGTFTGGGLGAGGGLEGVIGGGLGALANLFPSPVAGLGLGSFNALDALAAQDVANPLLAGIFQADGPVHGPGGPTGDRIPAFLSDGEFVVNAVA